MGILRCPLLSSSTIEDNLQQAGFTYIKNASDLQGHLYRSTRVTPNYTVCTTHPLKPRQIVETTLVSRRRASPIE